MKHLLLLSFAAVVSTLMAGCATERPLQVVDHIQRDTIYKNKVRYDSIYIDHRQTSYQQSDTVYLETTRYEYKYKLLRDTVYRVRIDTIPVIKEVEVVKEVPRPLSWYDHLARAALWLLIGALLLYKKKPTS